MAHQLDPLLRPKSIALVGASPRPGSYGNGMINACFRAGFTGDVFLVNPKYEKIEDRLCYPDIPSLPSLPDHAVLMVANPRIEAAFENAIDAGVKAATMFGSCLLDDGNPVPLLERLRGMALEAGVHVCGGNGSGFYNRVDRVRCQMGGGAAEAPGPVTFISQSGSISAAVSANDGRLKFNLTVSSGQEITTDASDYMDFALDLQGTRAIGLYIETIRKPEKFISVLNRAAEADIPVVIAKVARSEKGKKFAISHSGALAGDDAVFKAVFQRYGALSVDDPDELFAALQLLSTGRRAAAGSVVAIADSGGERELLADVASECDVSFAEISDVTCTALEASLEYGLIAENPLDAWGTGHGFEGTFRDSMAALMADPNAAVGIWVTDLRDGLSYHEGYANSAVQVAESTDKPLAFATCFAKGKNTELALRLAQAGIPVMEGMRASMVAARALLEYRSFQDRAPIVPPRPPDASIVELWRERCATGVPFSDAESFSLLADFGVPVVKHHMVNTRDGAIEAASELGLPVVMKTAMPGIFHKSDVGGVCLWLADHRAVAKAYDDLASRFGPQVLVSEMASSGVEMSFGFTPDPLFGPIAMVGAGGILVEVLRDTRFAVPPLDEGMARGLIDQLAIRPMLDGHRGNAACNVGALSQAFASFSVLIASLGPALSAVDVNPLIVTAEGVVAVDAFIVPKSSNENISSEE